MSFVMGFEESRQFLIISFSGLVTDEILLSRFELVREWLDQHGYFSNITDFTNVTSFEVTARAVRQLAFGAPLVPNTCMRVVVAPQDQTFGMARMFEMLGSASRDYVHVVRTSAEAFELADIFSPNVRPILSV